MYNYRSDCIWLEMKNFTGIENYTLKILNYNKLTTVKIHIKLSKGPLRSIPF